MPHNNAYQFRWCMAAVSATYSLPTTTLSPPSSPVSLFLFVEFMNIMMMAAWPGSHQYGTGSHDVWCIIMKTHLIQNGETKTRNTQQSTNHPSIHSSLSITIKGDGSTNTLLIWMGSMWCYLLGMWIGGRMRRMHIFWMHWSVFRLGGLILYRR